MSYYVFKFFSLLLGMCLIFSFAKETIGVSFASEDTSNDCTEKITSLIRSKRVLLKLHFMDYELHLRDSQMGVVSSFPLREQKIAQKAAERRHFNGYAFNLHKNSLRSFLKYSRDRALRKEMYNAYFGEVRDFNGKGFQEIYDELEALRPIQNSYFERKNLELKNQIDQERLTKQLSLISEYAKKMDRISSLQKWDYEYYMNSYKEDFLGINDAYLSEFLSFDNLLGGVFARFKRETGLKIYISREKIEEHGYDESVKVYKIMKDETLLGQINVKIRRPNVSLVQKEIIQDFAKVMKTIDGDKVLENSVDLVFALDIADDSSSLIPVEDFSAFIDSINYAFSLLNISGKKFTLSELDLVSFMQHYKTTEKITLDDFIRLTSSKTFFQDLKFQISIDFLKRHLYYQD